MVVLLLPDHQVSVEILLTPNSTALTVTLTSPTTKRAKVSQMNLTGGFGSFAMQANKPKEDEAVRRYVRQPAGIVSKDEFQNMIDALIKHKTRYPHARARARAVLATMYYAGLRRSEIIDLPTDQLILNGELPRIEIRRSKYGAGRNIPLDPRLTEHLADWIELRPNSPQFYCTYRTNTANIVSKGQPIGSPIGPTAIQSHIRDARRLAGITRRIHPHMFRHSAATNWLNSTLPDGSHITLRDVQYLLGHQNIHTTQRYLHVNDRDIANKVYQLGNAAEVTPTTPAQPIDLAELFDEPTTPPLPAAAASHIHHATTSAMKICEWCAETIRSAARICRYCQRECACG